MMSSPLDRLRLWLLLRLAFAGSSTTLAFTPTSDGLYAVFETNKGEFTARLYFEDVPQTVANFVGLAEGSNASLNLVTGAVEKKPYYDGIIFHRVIKNFVIQGGSPNGQGNDGPGYNILDEIDADHFHTRAGILSMAKTTAPNSGGSQFFVTLASAAGLDGNHSVFGEIVEGMPIVNTIGSASTDANDRPLIDIAMNHVRIVRQGDAAKAFDVSAHLVPVVADMADLWKSSTTPGTLSFEADGATLYQLFTSSNLVDWSLSDTVSHGESGAHGWNLATRAANAGALFANPSAISYPQSESHADESLTINLGNAGTIVLSLTAQAGTFVFGQNSGNLTRYDWYDFGSTQQVLVQYGSILAPMQVYLQDFPSGSRVVVRTINGDASATFQGTYQWTQP